MAEVEAGALMAEHMRQEDALVDLDAVLVALVEGRLRRDLLARRHQPGHRAGRGEDELFEADETRAVAGQAVVDPFGMGGEEALARLPRRRQDRRGGGRLVGAAPRFRRQPPHQRLGALPEGAVVADVMVVGAGRARLLCRPLGDG